MKSKKNPKIKYGKVDIPEDAFEPKNVKARITMWIGMDVLNEVKARAQLKGLPYQTYLNQLVKDSLNHEEKVSIESRLATLEATIHDIQEKIAG